MSDFDVKLETKIQMNFHHPPPPKVMLIPYGNRDPVTRLYWTTLEIFSFLLHSGFMTLNILISGTISVIDKIILIINPECFGINWR